MSSPDPFKLFQIEPAFELDLQALEQRHRDLSRALHPDRYVGASARIRRQALGRAIEVNEAWRLLRDPIRRAEALCQCLGLAVGVGNEPKAEPQLLMQVMEQREQLAEVRRSQDLASLRHLIEKVREQERESLSRLSSQFSVWQAGGQPNTEALLRDLAALRYYQRFLAEAASVEHDLL